LYRAYYDAYIHARLLYETRIESEANRDAKNGKRVGSMAALDQAQKILRKAVTERVSTELRARVFELAEALFQASTCS